MEQLRCNNTIIWSDIFNIFSFLADKELYFTDIKGVFKNNVIFNLFNILVNDLETLGEYEIDKSIVTFKLGDKTRKINKGNTNSIKQKVKYYTIQISDIDNSDIIIRLYNIKKCLASELSFSNKSHTGEALTLVNASRSTNFIFKINDKKFIDNIYPFEDKKGSEIIKFLKEFKPDLEFYDMSNPTFKNNLILLDSNMPIIISEMLKKHYIENEHKITEIIKIISENNKCNVPDSIKSIYYEYKIKDYLQAVALGMNPTTVWEGDFEATGGYIIVKEDGDVLCFHIYNRNDLREYLYENTKLDTGSTSRHEFGKIYKSNSELFINLNLQIRFI